MSRETVTKCDQCDVRISEFEQSFHLEPQGAVMRFDTDPSGWDFCSLRCAASWASDHSPVRQ